MSKYASSLVSNASDEMSYYVTGVSEDFEEQCHEARLHDNIDLSRLMIHDQQVEESCLRKSNREAKKARYFERCSSKSRLDIQQKPKFKKKFPN